MMTADTDSETSVEAPTEPVHIDSQAALNDVVGSNGVVMADFYADWCGPCQMLEPIVESLASETDAAVAKVDVDANQQLAAAFGVRGVPTLVLFANGEQVEEIVGMQSEDQLRSLIEGYTE
jgi:thioredoxin 1